MFSLLHFDIFLFLFFVLMTELHVLTFQFGTKIITTATKMRHHFFFNQGSSSQKLLLLTSVQDIIYSC